MQGTAAQVLEMERPTAVSLFLDSSLRPRPHCKLAGYRTMTAAPLHIPQSCPQHYRVANLQPTMPHSNLDLISHVDG